MQKFGIQILVQALLTVTWRLLENAMLGWGDDQIGVVLGINSPALATVAAWGIPFILAALTLWLYHLFLGRFTPTYAEAAHYARRKVWKKEMLPIVGMMLGGLLFIGCAVWAVARSDQTNQEILATLSRYVLPRHLSEAQKTIISSYLSQRAPQKVKFLVAKLNEEAGSYRADIQNALQAGGWEITAIDYNDDLPEGLSTRFFQSNPMPTSPIKYDAKNPSPATLFFEAMKLAKVQITQQETGGQYPDTLIIRVGKRRMDDGELTAKQRARERAREILRETDD